MYSLARAMLGDWRAAADLTMVVLEDALRGAHSPANLLVETHRRAATYLRDLRRRVPTSEAPLPMAAPLEDLDPVSRDALRLVFFRGYTFNEVAGHLGRSRTEVAQTVRAAITQLSHR